RNVTGVQTCALPISAVMTIPMIVLAVGSVALGGLLLIGDAFTSWLAPVTGQAAHAEPVLPVWLIMTATLVLVLAGAFIAWRRFRSEERRVGQRWRAP